MDAPGLPGCFPRLFFSARPAARRCLRGGLRPGRSSDDGGIEEFPLFRDPPRAAVSGTDLTDIELHDPGHTPVLAWRTPGVPV
jgi:hypothetical protein